MGKDENTGTKHFLPLLQGLKKAFLSELLEIVIVSQSIHSKRGP